MQVFNLPPQGTVVMIQGGLVLLGAALAAKWGFKRFFSKKSRS